MPGTGLEAHEAVGLAAGGVDHLPDVDAHPVAEHGQLVHQRDVHGAEDVLEQLRELGRLQGGHADDLVADLPVQVRRALHAHVGQAAHDPGRGAHRVVGAAGVDALGRVGDAEVAAGGEAGLLEERDQPLAGRAGIGGGLEHHELTALEHARHGRGGAQDRAEVGLAVARERRGHADDHGVAAGELRVARGREKPVADRFQARLGHVLHVALVALERRDLADVRVHAHHRVSRLAERDGQRQADVPHSDDADLHSMKLGPPSGVRDPPVRLVVAGHGGRVSGGQEQLGGRPVPSAGTFQTSSPTW